MVLWVVTILSVVVLEFCSAMRTEVNIARNFKEEQQLYAIAQGGIQRAIVELIYKQDQRIQQIRRTLKLEEIPAEKREWLTDGRPYLLPFDQNTCEVRIMGEGGKVNINTISQAALRKIIGQMGLEGEAKDTVVDSILDWIDADDLHRINGAENDYYQSLKEPYNAKNGKLDSIEELLLVRGVNVDLFYGKKGGKKEEGEGENKAEGVGLKDIFSIYAPGEQVDINSSTAAVLRVVLGIPNEVAQLIVKAREDKKFDNQLDLLQRVPELTPFFAEAGKAIVFQSAVSYYTIESRAKNHDGRSTRGIKVIVKIEARDKGGYKFIQWVDRLIES